MPVFSIFFGNVVDGLGLPGGAAKAPRAALNFVYLGLVAAAADALEGWGWKAAAARAASRLRSAAFEAALYKDAAWHESGEGRASGAAKAEVESPRRREEAAAATAAQELPPQRSPRRSMTAETGW